MKQVTWNELQFDREQQIYTKLRPVLERLKASYKIFAQRSQQQEKEFFKHLSHSVKIDQLENMAELLYGVNKRLHTELKVNLFLFQSPISNALCMPRSGVQAVGQKKELVVLVSQHFLNELTPLEQSSILGHELAHLLYGHIEIPANAVLNSQFPLKDTQDIKNDVLKWKICSEVSCDILGFLSCDCNVQAFQSALLKFTTGLTSPTMQTEITHEKLIGLIMQQFEEISSSVFNPVLTTHPLTPLRLKIIEAIADSELVKYYGQTVTAEALQKYKAVYNALIDTELKKIYPEFIPDRQVRSDGILFDLCVAVALADGKISHQEVSAIGKIIGRSNCARDVFQSVSGRLASVPAASIVNEIISKSTEYAKKQDYSKPQIFKIIRQLLVIAASETRIKADELNVIYAFVREFGVTKQEIGVLIAQMGLR